jgi:hypothetical protein
MRVDGVEPVQEAWIGIGWDGRDGRGHYLGTH